MHAKLVVGNLNHRDVQHELTRKEPPKSLLRNQQEKRKDKQVETVLKPTKTDNTATKQTLTTHRN